MSNNTIITIGRQYGSAGRDIGQLVAKELGIKCYDKELLKKAAKESGLCEELFENHDEKPSNSFLYSLVMDTYSLGYSSSAFVDMPLNHKIFLAQFDTIKKIADQESCVIVGRCADYALSDNKNCLSVFVHAKLEQRVRRIAGKYNLTDAKAKDLIHKTDKSRASYYNYYSSKKWGDTSSYQLSLDSSEVGIEGAAKIIREYLVLKQQDTPLI
ncbi:MAG: AAA family ATPase [Lachnotalea sp.]